MLLGLLSVIGCGGVPSDQPETASVTGTVTLNGNPLSNVIVTFSPTGGRPSVGTTDEYGSYTLQYTAKTPGAVIGEHTVSIAFAEEGDGGYGADEDDVMVSSLPTSASDGSIKKTVEAGSNEIPIEL